VARTFRLAPHARGELALENSVTLETLAALAPDVRRTLLLPFDALIGGCHAWNWTQALPTVSVTASGFCWARAIPCGRVRVVGPAVAAARVSPDR